MSPSRMSSARARFAFLVESRSSTEEQPAGLCLELGRRGHIVRLVDAHQAFESGDDSWLVSAHMVVARGSSVELLSLLREAEARRVPTLHRASTLATVQNKGRLLTRLRAAGVPVLLEPPPRPSLRSLAFAPRGGAASDEHAGIPSRIYAIGNSLWLGRSGPAVTEEDPEPISRGSHPELADLMDRCLALSGLRLFSAVFVNSRHGPALLDLEAFPDYRGVRGVSARLADEVMLGLKCRS